MKVNLIAAMDRHGVIGQKGNMPWSIPEELKLFKSLTEHNAVIMGRKTWDSLPVQPLPNRLNIVLSNSISTNNGRGEVRKPFTFLAHFFVSSIKEALDICKARGYDPFIIGGRSVYEQSLEKGWVDTAYISYIYEAFTGDTFFPNGTNFYEKYWGEYSSRIYRESKKFITYRFDKNDKYHFDTDGTLKSY